MQKMRKMHICLATNSRRAAILWIACLLGEGSCLPLSAQSVHVSVWSSAMDHSLESALVFRSQDREGADAYVRVYDDSMAQQIDHVDMNGASDASATNGGRDAPRTIDQEADTLIINPLKNGAQAISVTAGSEKDFLLIAQFSRAVKAGAYRVDSGVTGAEEIESLAFINPDGTYVLFTVNHSESPVRLQAAWKNRLLTFTQGGSSIAILAWDPKSQLISLVPQRNRISPEDSTSIVANCSTVAPLDFDLRCESDTLSCTVFPARFTCTPQQMFVTLVVTSWPNDTNNVNCVKTSFVTITASPDVGRVTRLRLPCSNSTSP